MLITWVISDRFILGGNHLPGIINYDPLIFDKQGLPSLFYVVCVCTLLLVG